jgi:DNA-binding GntR family transcriptional regulator
LARSERLDAFFDNLAAQLRLAFALMPDESAFQVSWVSRDREIADLILSGRRDEATALLTEYLNESEAKLIDGVRAAGRTQMNLRSIERTS